MAQLQQRLDARVSGTDLFRENAALGQSSAPDSGAFTIGVLIDARTYKYDQTLLCPVRTVLSPPTIDVTMSFACMATTSARTTLRSLQPCTPPLPWFTVPSLASFSTKAKAPPAPQNNSKLLKSLNRVAAPLAILTMNMPVEVTQTGVTQTGQKVVKREGRVHGQTVTNVSVICKNPPLLSLSIREDSPIHRALQSYRDQETGIAPQCVINMLDYSQTRKASFFALPEVGQCSVWEDEIVVQGSLGEPDGKITRDNGRAGGVLGTSGVDAIDLMATTKYSSSLHPLRQFEVSTGPRDFWGWCKARPPVLKTCHAAYVCTFESMAILQRSAHENDTVTKGDGSQDTPFENMDDLYNDEGSCTAILVRYVVRADSVADTESITRLPLVREGGYLLDLGDGDDPGNTKP